MRGVGFLAIEAIFAFIQDVCLRKHVNFRVVVIGTFVVVIGKGRMGLMT